MSSRSVLTAVLAVPLVAASLACGLSSTGSSSTAGDAPAKGVTSSAPAQATTVKVGAPLTVVDDVFGQKTTATITVANAKFGVKSGNEFVKPTKGQFVTVDVAVTVTAGKYSINSASFKLVAKDGTAYDATTMLDSADLSANDLTAGQKTTGKVAFDVAAGAQTGGRIALTSVLSSKDVGYWTF
jgi:hypothetical protein